MALLSRTAITLPQEYEFQVWEEEPSEDHNSESSTINLSTIPEAPEPNSDFRSHREVTDALVKTITSGDDGLGIALTGKLGSGKSSVVDRLKENLEAKDTEARVFIYDIWVHRGESLRRSFIEELARFLEGDVGWIKAKTADEAKKHVLEQETKSNNEITLVGAILAILLAVLPPSILLMRAKKEDVLAESLPLIGAVEIPIASTGFLVVSSILSMFAVGVILLILWKLVRWCLGKRTGGPSLLDRETSVTIQEADASTVDFRKAFEGLVGSALDKDPGRKLVIVLDNLDRFTPDDVYQTWGNLQTFFDLSSSNRGVDSSWHQRFWTILPFSPEAPYRLRDMLNGGDRTGEGTFNFTGETPPFDEYIEKTFQLRFRVSPPVQSDYEEYFAGQFGKAIKGLGNQETVFRVRDLFFRFFRDPRKPAGTLQATPRTVNRFLNDLVGSIRQHGKTPPIPVQAYFLLLKRIHGEGLTSGKNPVGKRP